MIKFTEEGKPMRCPKMIYVLLILFPLLTGCSTAKHGSFITSTYIQNKDNQGNTEEIGPVKGSSCQTMMFYVLPMGPAPSTNEAIESAKNQYPGTKYISDISIDDRVEWKIGYSIQCITVEGIAHK
ncbi:hypothetical protein [Psychrilyobacter atlanticus]|uniref:hypothetical protein n=1 Tax=Psychrilyobacter atlanticus TaxID=271091 RepID=UPI0012EC05F9|nr:hypothetical protein [Psychrilyobacter atlanticus]